MSVASLERSPAWKRVFSQREFFTCAVLGTYCIILLCVEPSFFRCANILSILYTAALLVPAVLGMQALLITGAFDLSVGSISAASAVVVGVVLRDYGNVPAALTLGLVTAMAFGLLNGILVARLKINSLIATLGSMSIARAFALGIPHGRVTTNFPSSFESLAHSEIQGIPLTIPICVCLIFVADWAFRNVQFFRWFYSIGSNAQAATYCGIRVPQIQTVAFLLTGLGSFLCGVLQASRSMSASPLLFEDLSLEAIAACVVGGSSLKGGVGSMLGSVLGLLVLIITRNIVVLLGVPVYWRELFVGVVLLVAVAYDMLLRRMEKHEPFFAL